MNSVCKNRNQVHWTRFDLKDNFAQTLYSLSSLSLSNLSLTKTTQDPTVNIRIETKK